MSETCICGSGKASAKCCQRFLSGAQRAKTPEQLMRSRYAAYALGGHGDYLLRTWFPATAAGVTADALSAKSKNWTGLRILAKSQNGDDGEVEFQASYTDSDGRRQLMHEKSVFTRVAGHWLYVGGEVSTTPG